MASSTRTAAASVGSGRSPSAESTFCRYSASVRSCAAPSSDNAGRASTWHRYTPTTQCAALASQAAQNTDVARSDAAVAASSAAPASACARLPNQPWPRMCARQARAPRAASRLPPPARPEWPALRAAWAGAAFASAAATVPGPASPARPPSTECVSGAPSGGRNPRRTCSTRCIGSSAATGSSCCTSTSSSSPACSPPPPQQVSRARRGAGSADAHL